MATPVQILFNTLVKLANTGKFNAVDDVIIETTHLCDEYGLSLTEEQIQIFSEKFYAQYVEPNDLEDLFEEPEDEIEIIKKKIAAYRAKLETNPANRISIMSMISKLRKKLRDLGGEDELPTRTVTEPTIEALRAKLEQLEVDLALAPIQKRKSVQSMISKIKRKLRELGDESVNKPVAAKVVKLTPAQKINLDETVLLEEIEAAVFNNSEPMNKNIIRFLVYYVKNQQVNGQSVTREDLAKFINKYHKNIFTDKFTEIVIKDDSVNIDLIASIADVIEKVTLKNVANSVKSMQSLSINAIVDLVTDYNDVILNNEDVNIIKKIAKCTDKKQAIKLLEK